MKIIMAQYTNSTPNSNDWNFYFQPFPYSEGLVVLLILLYRLKIQLQKPNRRRNVKLIQRIPKESSAPTEYSDELVCLHARF